MSKDYNINWLPDDSWTELDDYHVKRILSMKDHPLWKDLTEEEKQDPEKKKYRVMKWWHNQTANKDHMYYDPSRQPIKDFELPDYEKASDGTVMPKVDLNDHDNFPYAKDFKFNPNSKLSISEQYHRLVNPDIFPPKEISYKPKYNYGILGGGYLDESERGRDRYLDDLKGYYSSLKEGELPTYAQQYAFETKKI